MPLPNSTWINCKSSLLWRALLVFLRLQNVPNHLLTRFTYENLLPVSVVDRKAAHYALEEICGVCVFACMFVFVAYGSTTQFSRAKNQGILIHKTYSNTEHRSKNQQDQQPISTQLNQEEQAKYRTTYTLQIHHNIWRKYGESERTFTIYKYTLF